MSNTITSLKELKAWSPGDEKPVVMDWYLDYVFDVVLKKKKYSLFEEYFDAMVEFSQYCEGHTIEQSFLLTLKNLKYWQGRASKSDKPFKKYINKVVVKYLGYKYT